MTSMTAEVVMAALWMRAVTCLTYDLPLFIFRILSCFFFSFFFLFFFFFFICINIYISPPRGILVDFSAEIADQSGQVLTCGLNITRSIFAVPHLSFFLSFFRSFILFFSFLFFSFLFFSFLFYHIMTREILHPAMQEMREADSTIQSSKSYILCCIVFLGFYLFIYLFIYLFDSHYARGVTDLKNPHRTDLCEKCKELGHSCMMR